MIDLYEMYVAGVAAPEPMVVDPEADEATRWTQNLARCHHPSQAVNWRGDPPPISRERFEKAVAYRNDDKIARMARYSGGAGW